MQDFPDEIISEIIMRLSFDAVNPFARAHPKFARLVKAAAIDIADENTDYNFQDECEDKNGYVVNIYRMTLPNGVSHGRTEFNRDEKIIFRLTYSLGKPTFWRVLEHATVVWGHVESPYFVYTYDDDDFSGAQVRFDIRDEQINPADINNVMYISYDKRGKSKVWDGKNPAMCIPGVISPASIVVDGDISLAEIEKWGGQVLRWARLKWPNVTTVNCHTDIFDDEPGVLEAIFKYCPGVSALIRRPKT